jgi:DNA-binding transcriptional LysR family regulator
MPFKRGQLRNFLVVVEEGQMTRAAKRLHMAQPALSQAIAQLEAELGIVLLARHPRGVRLTPAGEAFLPKARAAVIADAEATMAARTLAHGDRARLELGFFGVPPSAHSAELLAAFTSVRPEVELCFRELPIPSGTTASWIREVDVALCHHCLMEPGVRALAVRVERRMMLVSRRHPLARRSELLLEDVLDETFIGFTPDANPDWVAFWQLSDHRGKPARTSLDRIVTPLEMLATIGAGKVVTALPECHAHVVANVLDGLVAIPIVDADPTTLHLVWREDNDGPLVRDLVSVAAQAGQLFGSDGKAAALDPSSAGLEHALENLSDRLGERRAHDARGRSQQAHPAKPRPTG